VRTLLTLPKYSLGGERKVLYRESIGCKVGGGGKERYYIKDRGKKRPHHLTKRTSSIVWVGGGKPPKAIQKLEERKGPTAGSKKVNYLEKRNASLSPVARGESYNEKGSASKRNTLA